MTWAEATETLRYLYRPLATHVHILLIACLLLALGLGGLQNGSSNQSGEQQTTQTPSTTQLSTSPIAGSGSGDSNTGVSGPKSSSSGSYEAQSNPQQNAYAPSTPLTTGSSSTDNQNGDLTPGCDDTTCTPAPSQNNSTTTPEPNANTCSGCDSATWHHHWQRSCPTYCPPATTPSQGQAQ